MRRRKRHARDACGVST